jgi:hypothetical protein
MVCKGTWLCPRGGGGRRWPYARPCGRGGGEGAGALDLQAGARARALPLLSFLNMFAFMLSRRVELSLCFGLVAERSRFSS